MKTKPQPPGKLCHSTKNRLRDFFATNLPRNLHSSRNDGPRRIFRKNQLYAVPSYNYNFSRYQVTMECVTCAREHCWRSGKVTVEKCKIHKDTDFPTLLLLFVGQTRESSICVWLTESRAAASTATAKLEGGGRWNADDLWMYLKLHYSSSHSSPSRSPSFPRRLRLRTECKLLPTYHYLHSPVQLT